MENVFRNISGKELTIDFRDEDSDERFRSRVSAGGFVVIPKSYSDRVMHMVESGNLEVVDESDIDIINVEDRVDTNAETKVLVRKKAKKKPGVFSWVFFILLSLIFFPFFILVNVLSPLFLIVAIFIPRYGGNVFVAYDQLGNAVFGGDPDETISSRVGKAAKKGSVIGKAFSWYLSVPDPDHCNKSIEKDEGKDGIF